LAHDALQRGLELHSLIAAVGVKLEKKGIEADLGTLCLNKVAAAANPNYVLTMTTRPTAIQQKALELLGVPLAGARRSPYPVTEPCRRQYLRKINEMHLQEAKSSA
jgi:hypothetical protein